MDERFVRLKVLGRGRLGKVYLVKDTNADELLVVKQMETSMMAKGEKSDVVKEAMSLKKLEHPNIISPREVFMTRKGRLCMLQQYADGGTLKQIIRQRKGELIPEYQILDWLVQICFALKYIHHRKFKHKNLSSNNVFLMSTGQVKVADFGLPVCLEYAHAGHMGAMPYYMSPEIIQDRPYEYKTDVWSCGVLLYEVMTLRHPFDADSLVILASNILKNTYPPPDPCYSAELLAVLKDLLCKDVKSRPNINEVMKEHSFLREHMFQANEKYALGLDLSFITPLVVTMSAVFHGESVELSCAGLGGNELAKLKVESSRTFSSIRTLLADEIDKSRTVDFVLPDGTWLGKSADARSLRDLFGIVSAGEEDLVSAGEVDSDDDLEYSAKDLAMSIKNLNLAPTEDAKSEDAPPVSANGNRFPEKADSLRTYLKSRMPEPVFMQALLLVQTGELPPEVLQQQVEEIIGAECAAEGVLPLLQLLAFLEEMARGSPETDPA